MQLLCLLLSTVRLHLPIVYAASAPVVDHVAHAADGAFTPVYTHFACQCARRLRSSPVVECLGGASRVRSNGTSC